MEVCIFHPYDHTSFIQTGSLLSGGNLPDNQQLTSFVQVAQAGDDFAFAELVRAYQDIAVAYATSILGD
ncbi:MAG TPA: hypothetical protein VEF04_22045, partial [Blastocatellia bacterium]|nr:hypothetical protein [Blastocatellia bacterium]